MRLPATIIMSWFCAACALGQELDTIRYFDRRYSYVHYDNPAITVQAARFDLAGPCAVRGVVITLGGPSRDGAVTVHLYGHEGGIAAPLAERDLIDPIVIRKTKGGHERVTVELPEPISTANNQLFVAIDNVDPGVLVLSDRKYRKPVCEADGEEYHHQLLKTGNGWQWASHAFAIDLIVEYDDRDQRSYLADVSEDLGLPDTTLANTAISWGDLDDDGFVDLLSGGRLFHNDAGVRFTDITSSVGMPTSVAAHVFIDANRDGRLDILLLGVRDSSGGGILLLNQSAGTFARTPLSLPSLRDITSVSLADINNDNYPDLFVGTGGEGKGDERSRHLFVNTGSGGFTDESNRLLGERSGVTGARGSQWLDFNRDGHLDLFVAGGASTRGELWVNRGDGTFANAWEEKDASTSSDWKSVISGCHWADYDNNGTLDLLLPRTVTRLRAAGEPPGTTSIYRNIDGRLDRYEGLGGERRIEYEEKQAGGAWGDVNNDGRLDLVLTTGSHCRFAELYMQRPDGSFEMETRRYGLYRVAADADAIWVDYDNDGRVDMATMIEGRLHILRNTAPPENNYATFDLKGAAAEGARVTVQTGETTVTRDMIAGRGVLMQDPYRLHFGVSDSRVIDRVTVVWPDGRVDTHTGVAVNQLHELRPGKTVRSRTGEMEYVEASPNPFRSLLNISYRIIAREKVTLTIHAIDGTLVKVLVDEMQGTGHHEVTWDGFDAAGRKMAQGTYVYRLRTASSDLNGKVVLLR